LGTHDLTENETDVEIQQAMLDEFNDRANLQAVLNEHGEPGTPSESESKREETTHEKARTKETQSKKRDDAKRGRSLSVPALQDMENLIDQVAGNRTKPTRPAKKRRDEDRAMQPVRHITDNSALGRAFKRVAQNPDSGGSPSDSSLDTSESSESSDSDSPSSSSDDDADARRRSRRKHSKKHKSARRKQKSLLKPIPPEKYNGAADLQMFYKFMNDATSYLKQGHVPRKDQVDILSH